MDEDQPTTLPDHLDESAHAAPSTDAGRVRRRGVFGLPARLALVTLLAIAVFAAGLAAFADHRMQDANAKTTIATATSVARDAASQYGESDFARTGGSPAALKDRLASLRNSDASVRSIALFRAGTGGAVDVVAHSSGANVGELRSVARTTIRSREESGSVHGRGSSRHASVAWPVLSGDGHVAGVLTLEYRVQATGPGAVVADSRRSLALGALIAAAALGATLLLLMRRELFRPLEELRGAMLQVRGGARGVRIGWTRTDELGTVADAFDSMLEELETAEAELARYVKQDPLTGLLNKDAFTDRFSGELTRARREGYPITLLAIDLDALEELNRTHDRAAGDQVLATVGEIIGSCTRPTDAAGRTGGDSFHVALVGADAAQASVVVQRIRREIAQRVGIGPERTRVTCGYGVAEFPTHAVDQIALERMAEAACSHAQRDGRDRAVAFGPAGGYVDALSLVPDEQRSGERPAGERELASTVHALARNLDGIDPALGGGAHSQRVARYAVAVARELEFTDSQLSELRSAAVLHDIGKVAVPPSILRTPEDQLDDRQRGALRYHAWVARTMIAGAGLDSVADIVFHMSERWDGTGYPERFREDAIPVASRVLRAAELLDQLHTGQAGAAPMDGFRAAGELKRRAGEELDPDVAVRLARLVREDGLLGNLDADTDVADAA
jgi:diguanylate cyclase (GGDEF)-like protein